MQWFAVHTKPRSEDLAVVHLKTKGLEVFLPKIQVLRKRGSQKVALMEPLFPGYFFVHMLPAKELINQVNWTPGVKRLLCAGDTPVPVPDAAIDLIRQRIGPRSRQIPTPRREFAAGSQVAIRHGPFAGLMGVIEKPVSARGRVRVLLELLQRQVAVEVDAIDLDRLGSGEKLTAARRSG